MAAISLTWQASNMAAHRPKFPTDPEIGNRIRAVMKFNGVGQKELAEALGISQSAVAQWVSPDVTARVKPSEENARAIGAFFDEEVDFLMNRATGGSKGLGAIYAKLSAGLARENWEHLETLTPKQIREMIEAHELLTARERRLEVRRKRVAPPATTKK